MKQLSLNEISLTSGGINYGYLIDASSAMVGGLIGYLLAPADILMTHTATVNILTGAVAFSSAQTPLVPFAAFSLGASIGYAISHGIQMSTLVSEK